MAFGGLRISAHSREGQRDIHCGNFALLAPCLICAGRDLDWSVPGQPRAEALPASSCERVHCRIEPFVDQGGACGRRWPGVSGGLGLGEARPPHAGPQHTGHTGQGSPRDTQADAVRSRLPRLGGLASHAIGYADHGSGDHSQGSAPTRKTGTPQATVAEGRGWEPPGIAVTPPAGAGKTRVMAAVRFETFSRA